MSLRNRLHAACGLSAIAFVAVAVWMAACIAPTEQSMGDIQRVLYVHVSVAWLGLCGFAVMAVSGVGYLLTRNLRFDHWFQSAGELGWITSGLTLATGSIWAHEAWGTWWEWEPRLTASFVLWLIYCAILLVRGSLDDPHQRARIGGVLGVMGAADLPLVMMATRWFRGMHPVSPQMDPLMRWTLLVNVLAFTALFAWLITERRKQLRFRQSNDDLQRTLIGRMKCSHS